MKPRRIVVTIEGDSAWPLRGMQRADEVTLRRDGKLVGIIMAEQVQTNAVRRKPPLRKSKPRNKRRRS